MQLCLQLLPSSSSSSHLKGVAALRDASVNDELQDGMEEQALCTKTYVGTYRRTRAAFEVAQGGEVATMSAGGGEAYEVKSMPTFLLKFKNVKPGR